MDSYYPRHPIEDDTDWEEVEKIPVPSTKPRQTSISSATTPTLHLKTSPPNTSPKEVSSFPPIRKSMEKSNTDLEENEDLMSYLSTTLRKNSFIESKARTLSVLNQQLSDKNIFLQDQFLILKEKHESILQNNSRVIQALQNNSQELKSLKQTFGDMKTSLKTSETERKHLLGLNRHIVGKLTSLLKENSQIKVEHTRVNSTSQKHSLEINKLNQLNKNQNKHYKKKMEIFKKSLSKYYKDDIQNLKKSLNFNEKEHLSQVKILKKHIQQMTDQHEKIELQMIKSQTDLEKKYQTEIQQLTDKHKKALQTLQKNHITAKQKYLNKIHQICVENKRNESDLKKKHTHDITNIAKEKEELKQEYLKQTQKLTDEYESSEKALKENQKWNMRTVKEQYLTELKEQEDKQKQIITELEKAKQHIISQADKVSGKYKRLKEKWNNRITRVISKKNQTIKKLTHQNEEQKNHLAQVFKNKEISFKKEQEDIIQKIKKEFETSANKHKEEKKQLIEEFKQEKEEQCRIHTLNTQKLIHEKNQNIEQIQKEQNQKLEEDKAKSKKIIMEKEQVIVELSNEVENWSQNYANYEQDTQKKLNQIFETEKLNLINEKEIALTKMEQYYKNLISSIKEKQKQELKYLKEKQDDEFDKKSSLLDERIMELKEEHDNQIHHLRVEMEHELLAEKRKSVAENEKNNNEIQKMQKTLLELQSDRELKNLKIINMQLESTTTTEELQKLREDNQTLKKHNNKLNIFWESQGPKMEEQQQQITSLQKLNRQLSQYIHENQSSDHSENPLKDQSTHSSTDNNELSNSQKNNNIRELLKQIHLHDNNP